MKKAGYQTETSIKAGSLYDDTHTTHNDAINREKKGRQIQTEKQMHINIADRQVQKLP